MGKTTFTRMGNRGLSCLEWCLRGGSVMLAVLIPALVRPEKEVWVAAGAAGVCMGACQGLLLLAGRARKAKAVRAASEAICAGLEERINNDPRLRQSDHWEKKSADLASSSPWGWIFRLPLPAVGRAASNRPEGPGARRGRGASVGSAWGLLPSRSKRPIPATFTP
jgi:hypothetical protein